MARKKAKRRTARISTWSLNDHPDYKAPFERLGPRQEAIRKLKVEASVLARSKQKLFASSLKGKKKGKAKSNPQQRLIVSGGLPSLGKRR